MSSEDRKVTFAANPPPPATEEEEEDDEEVEVRGWGALFFRHGNEALARQPLSCRHSP